MPALFDPQIITYTGQKFHVFNPSPAQVRLVDIVWSLSQKCRWGGHTPGFYSVAHHSLAAGLIEASEARAFALLHDACEAYLPDVPTPLKPYLLLHAGGADYKTFSAVEDAILASVWAKIGQYPSPNDAACVHAIDTALACAEWTQLLGRSHSEYLLAADRTTLPDGLEVAEEAVCRTSHITRDEIAYRFADALRACGCDVSLSRF